MNATARAQLTADLESAVVRALSEDWDTINYNHFRRALRRPAILLADALTRLGQWSLRDRTIEIARHLVLDHPWGVVLEVLKHEMAHQYVEEVLGVRDQTAHGEAFQRVCAQLGIDGTASGLPRLAAPVDDDEARVLGRIAKLLALAESPERHEAEAAMREAQRLMLKHNVAAAQAGRRRSDYGFRHLGEPTGRVQAHQRLLASILGDHFFVEPIWVSVFRPQVGMTGTVLEICGTPANLEMAAYAHDFLMATAERLFQQHKRAERVRGNAGRRSYLAGVMRGFQKKLEAEAQANKKEGLVWVGDADLRRYFDARYPRRTMRASAARAEPGAFAAGERAGQSIVLHRPVTSGGSSSGRALPARRG